MVSDNIHKMAELYEAMAVYHKRISLLVKEGHALEKAFNKEMAKLEKRTGTHVRDVANSRYVPSFDDGVYESKTALAFARQMRAFGRKLEKANDKDVRETAQAKKLAERLAKKADKAVKAKKKPAKAARPPSLAEQAMEYADAKLAGVTPPNGAYPPPPAPGEAPLGI